MGRESAEAGPSHSGTGRARAGPLCALGDQAWVRALRRSVEVWAPKCRGFILELGGSGASHTGLLHPDVTQFPSSSPRWSPYIGRVWGQEAAQAPIGPAAPGFAAGRRRRRRGRRQGPGPAGGSPALTTTPNALCGPSSPLLPAWPSLRRPVWLPVPSLPLRGAAPPQAPKSRVGIGRGVLTPPPRPPSAFSPRKGAVPDATPQTKPRPSIGLSGCEPHPILPPRPIMNPRYALSWKAQPTRVPLAGAWPERGLDGPGRGLCFSKPLIQPLALPTGLQKRKLPWETVVFEP